MNRKKMTILAGRYGWLCRPCWCGLRNDDPQPPACPECGETMAAPHSVPDWTDEEKAGWDERRERPMSTLAAIESARSGATGTPREDG